MNLHVSPPALSCSVSLFLQAPALGRQGLVNHPFKTQLAMFMNQRPLAIIALLGLTSTLAVLAENEVILTIAGNGKQGFSGDGGLATNASLFLPLGVAVDDKGNIFIADTESHRIRKVEPSGRIQTVAGNGRGGFSGDGGRATDASLFYPQSVAVDGKGNIFIADTRNHRVRKVEPSGVIKTVAGNGREGFSGDGGRATDASLHGPTGVAVAVDGRGSIFIADSYNHRVRKVEPSGVIKTVAGNGRQGFSGDGGRATDASLSYPQSVAVNGKGNIFIADTRNHRIRKVEVPSWKFHQSSTMEPSDVIKTVAGNGRGGFSGDGGLATDASLHDPTGVAVGGTGNIFIADHANRRIRKVNPPGVIKTVAGNGQSGFSGDGGLATDASLHDPTGVAVDGTGSILIVDNYYNHIRKMTRLEPVYAYIVAQHNVRRAGHGAPPLVWHDALAVRANTSARSLPGCTGRYDKSAGQHDYDLRPGAGENRYAVRFGPFGWTSVPGRVANAVQEWYKLEVAYNYENKGFSARAAEFTQLVWVGSQKIGCAVASCYKGDRTPVAMLVW
jgi:hypothetical protein